MKCWTRLGFSLLIGVGLGCTGARQHTEPHILLEPAERQGYWRATYQFGHPVDYLRFQRPAGFFRESVWEILTPGWSLEREDDRQVLVAEAGVNTLNIVAEFPVHTENLPKEYEFFQSFTDGSVSIYSGHLYLSPTHAGAMEEEIEYVRRVELVPLPGQKIVVHGQVLDERTMWEDPHEDGTFIYFGNIDPLETEEMVAILDPGAPAWLLERINTLLPRMFELYTTEFGESLPWKPVVLFSFSNDQISGFSSGGGTLAGLVQMYAVGEAWQQETSETGEHMLYLLAHEAVHLWNGQLISFKDDSDSWMHEGSADAFAELVLERWKFIDATRLAQRRTEALSRCALGLMDGSLSSSRKRGKFHNYYSCGNLIAVWSAAALDSPAEFEKLFDVWHKMIEISESEGDKYDRETYFQAMSSLGAETEVISGLREFIDATHSDPSAALVEFLDHVGLKVQKLDRPQPGQRREWAAIALQHLMAASCNGGYSVSREGGRLRTGAMADCQPFDRELKVVALENHSIESDGDLAYQGVAKRCQRGEDVSLGLEEGPEVTVSCTSPPPPAPAPLAFPRIQPK